MAKSRTPAGETPAQPNAQASSDPNLVTVKRIGGKFITRMTRAEFDKLNSGTSKGQYTIIEAAGATKEVKKPKAVRPGSDAEAGDDGDNGGNAGDDGSNG